MSTIAIPSPLHDVFGRHQSRLGLALIAIVVPLAIVSAWPLLEGIAWWRAVLAALLIADLAAGAVANVTAGTNDYYAERPVNRWVFLAVHFHLPVIAWLLGLPLMAAFIAWAATIAAGILVNVLNGRAEQRTVAGAGFVAILCLLTVLPDQHSGLIVLSAVFAFKVAFAFAVDHRADSHPAPLNAHHEAERR